MRSLKLSRVLPGFHNLAKKISEHPGTRPCVRATIKAMGANS